MSNTEQQQYLSFEKPIFELEQRLESLTEASASSDVSDEIQRLRLGLADLKKKVYANLNRWNVVEVSRHPNRPQTADYLDRVFDEFVELHGDRFFGDDRAMRTGWAKIDGQKVMVVGHQKGRNAKERIACHFGCAHPEGYRKAIGKMKMAAKFGLPVICFIDTPGAFPGVASEERGVAEAIAESMFEMSRLRTPIICVVIGEGGSGGALGIGVGDRVAMLQYAYYSVISPEGCSGILWKNDQNKDKAAEALKFTSSDLLKMKVIDAVIEEPLGGAHRDPNLMASRLKLFLRSQLRQLRRIPIEQLVEQRYQRFRQFGVFFENRQQAEAAPDHGALF
ncbi:MAG: acetyl-CoA carboxylase carboxyltransferase subunit alpha [Thermoguttaceae bacterium]|nr:acetyl-CoA carboxylase carboxyltransferase subunit alpha [Thermoguttaceae bacterium]MBR2585839.1 acetyl-CoA carboxylase carboxyltransferase subunit alpha [Thermoguttaceae bacterium]